MIIQAVTAGAAVAATVGLVVLAVRARRGKVVFQYPSGKPTPDTFNPLVWRKLIN
jgi:hypothetical protein